MWSWLSSLFTNIIFKPLMALFGKYTGLVSNTLLWVAFTAMYFMAVAAALLIIKVTAPEIVVKAWNIFMPDNAMACINAVFYVRTITWVYILKIQLALTAQNEAQKIRGSFS